MILFRPYMIDLCFKSVDGRRLFYPHARFSSGRLVDPERETALRSFMAKWYVAADVAVIAGILLQATFGISRSLIFDAAALLLLLVVYYAAMARLLKDCPRTDIRISSREIRLKQARAMSVWQLRRLLGLSILMTGLSVLGFRIGMKTSGWTMVWSGAGILLFGACIILSIYLMRLRRTPAPTP